jgi:hypothetical protein
MRLLFLICLFPLISFAQTKDEKEILSILDKQTQAWNAGDLEKFMVGYLESDSLMYIGKAGLHTATAPP